MAELLGTHSYQLDPKGRISLPSRFREAFADGAVLTLGQDGCLFCFPRAEWEERSREVHTLPLSDTEARAYARMFFGKAEAVELDAQGRLLIPQRLRSVRPARPDRRRRAFKGVGSARIGRLRALEAARTERRGVPPRRGRLAGAASDVIEIVGDRHRLHPFAP